jgi:hypothetical protein
MDDEQSDLRRRIGVISRCTSRALVPCPEIIYGCVSCPAFVVKYQLEIARSDVV